MSSTNEKIVDETVTEPIKPFENINFKLVVSSSGSSVVQESSSSNIYTSYSGESATANAAANAAAHAAASTAQINRHIARTLQQTGEAVRRSLQEAQEDFREAFRSAGFWGKWETIWKTASWALQDAQLTLENMLWMNNTIYMYIHNRYDYNKNIKES